MCQCSPENIFNIGIQAIGEPKKVCTPYLIKNITTLGLHTYCPEKCSVSPVAVGEDTGGGLEAKKSYQHGILCNL